MIVAPLCPQYRFTVPVAHLNHVTTDHRTLLIDETAPPLTNPLPLPVLLSPPGNPVPLQGFGVVDDIVIGEGRLWASGVLDSRDHTAVRDWVGALRLGAAAFALNLDETDGHTINAGDRHIRVLTHWRLTGLTVRIGPPTWTTVSDDIDITHMTSEERRTWRPKPYDREHS